MKRPCVYIVTNRRNGVLYTGVSSDLPLRMSQHVQGLFPGFTKKYGLKSLVYYEMHASMADAIKREKQIKEWQRAWKIRLIEQMNPEWVGLFNRQTGELSDGPADVARFGNWPHHD